MIQFGVYSMGSFCSFWEEYFDCNTLQLRGIECCYPYHLISYCIYEEKTRTTYKTINKCCVSHLQQTKYMIPMSPVDNLISKNLLKMKENHTKNKYFTRLQEKISKTENNVHADYITNTRRKPKINWMNCFPDRRRSRRLSNLPPVDEIKVEIKNEDMSKSFDNISYSILAKNEIILSNDYYIKSEDYVDYKIKLEPTDNIDTFQDDDIGIDEDILDESNLKSDEQNLFVEIKTKDNQNSFNTLENTNNIPETQFNVDEPTSFKSTINYDNINLNPDKKHEHSKILSSWNANTFDRDSNFEKTKTQETPKSYSINTETEKIASVHKTYSEKIKMNQIQSLQGKNSEAIEAENIPSLSEMCSKVLETGEMPNFSKNGSSLTEKEQISFLPETNSEIINTENMSSLPETTKPENILFQPEQNPISTDPNTIQTVSDTLSEVINKENIPSPSEQNSGNTETKEIKSLPKIYSKIIDIENMPSPPEAIEIYDTEEVPSISNIYSEIIDIENMTPPPEVIEISDTEEVPTISEIYPEIINIENMPSTLETIEISDTEEVPTVSKMYSGTSETNKNLPLRKSMIIDIENMPSPPEAIEISDTEEIQLLSPYSEIPATKKTPFQQDNTYSEISRMQKSSPKITVMDELHNCTDKNGIVVRQVQPFVALKNRRVLPKFRSKNIANKKNDYFNMTLNEKVLYRRKLNFMTAIGLVTKEKFAEIMKSMKPIVKRVISKKSYPKVRSKVNEDYMERNYNRTSSDKVRRSFFLEYSNNKNNEGHKAVPILIPEKTSGTSFHPLRTCMHKCGNCHGKFGSLDTPYHLAQIKNIDKQKACLENSTPLIGPDSCLCATCFRTIEKRSCRTYLPRDSCIIKRCNRTTVHICESLFIDKIKNAFQKRGFTFRTWPNKIESMPFCDLHYNTVLYILDCHLCGNRTEEKFEIKEAELETFKSSLNYDKLPIVLNQELLICKACRIYLLWRCRKISPNIKKDFIKLRSTVLKRICDYKKIVLPSFVLDLYSETMELQMNTEMEKKKHLPMLPSKPVENYDNHFVMVSSLRTIDNDKVFSGNYYAQNNCSQSLQTEINTITKPVANKSTTVIAGNQQPNQQLVRLGVAKKNNSDNQIVPPHVVKRFSRPPVITKSMVGKQTVFVPVLQSVDRKQFQASANKLLLKCQPNKLVQPLQPPSVQKVLNTVNTLPPPPSSVQKVLNTVNTLPPPPSMQKVLNTVNTLPPPPPAAIPFVRQSPMECSNHSARVTGRVLKIFRSMQRHYPTPIRLIKHLLVMEKSRVLNDLIYIECKRPRVYQKVYKLNANALEGFRRGFSQNKFQSGTTNGNIVKAVVKPLCDGIATVKKKDDNDCKGKIGTIQKVNGLCKVVSNSGHFVIRNNLPSKKNVTSSPNTTNPIKIPNSKFNKNVLCNSPPKVNNNKSCNGDSILSSNGVIIPPTYAATAVTGTTTKPVQMSPKTTITIPSINRICANTNKRFIVLKKNNNNEVNGSRNLTTIPSNLTNISTMKPLYPSTIRKNFPFAFNNSNVIKIQPLRSIIDRSNDKTMVRVCPRD